MPRTKVVFFQKTPDDSPVLEWLKTLRNKDPKGYTNCIARIKLLAESGYELRRPAADYLRDGIYELRAKHRNIQYRILYFFYGQNVAILAHAIIKEKSSVPSIDIKRAIERKELFESNPETYTYSEDN